MTATASFRTNRLAQLIAVMATSLLVGGFAVLTLFVIWTLTVAHRSMPIMHKTLFGASIVMFIISVIFLGLVMHELSTDTPSVVNRQAQVIISVLQYVTGDIIIIWRVWVVWGHRRVVIVGPIVILIVGAGFSLNLVFATDLFYTVVPVALIVANTSLCTFLIAGRIWYLHRQLARSGNIRAGSPVSNRYKGIILVVVESGALYTCAAIVSLILNFKNSAALPIVLDLEIPLIGILPTLIIVLVHLDVLSPSKDRIQPIAYDPSIHTYGPRDSVLQTTRIIPLVDYAKSQALSETPPKHDQNFGLHV